MSAFQNYLNYSRWAIAARDRGLAKEARELAKKSRQYFSEIIFNSGEFGWVSAK